MTDYRARHYLDLRPALAHGGHTFTLIDDQLERCLRCHVTLPQWAVREHLGHQYGLAAICPDLMRALGR